MQLEFLGSGGAITTPRPLCNCAVCVEARLRGVPYSRKGPSIFVHGPDVLIDTPEEIKDQINRSLIATISAGLYSHWHPDHTAGSRVWETLNYDSRGWPARSRRTPIYLPEGVAADWPRWLGLKARFDYLEQQGTVKVIEVPDGAPIELADVRIEPFRLAEEYVYGFVFTAGASRVLIAMDELFGWVPPPHLAGMDLAVLPMGIAEVHPLTGERRLPADHPVLRREATFEQTLAMVRQLQARRVILTHVEEPFGLSHADLLLVAEQLRQRGIELSFAYDTLLVNV